MGLVVKIYIETNEREIDIVTLNSEDQKCSSVTITSKFVKDFLNSFEKEDFCGSDGGNKINLSNQNNDKCQTDNSIEPYCSLSDKSVQSNSNLPNVGLDLNANQANNLRCPSSVDHNSNESMEQLSSNSLPQTERNIQATSLNNQIDCSPECFDESDAPNSTQIEDSHNASTDTDKVSSEVPANDSQISDYVDPCTNNTEKRALPAAPSDDIEASGSEVACVRESGLINLLSSSLADEMPSSLENLKYMTFDVDDFLNLGYSSSQLNQLDHQSHFLSLPLLLDNASGSPSNQFDEKLESDSEEYFVVEKIVASRLNPETSLVEFLLKAEICSSRKDSWSPLADPNVKHLSFTNPKCLYIQCPKSLSKFKRRKLYDNQDLIFLNLDNVCPLDLNTEVSSSCRPVDGNTRPGDFSAATADVLKDPHKMLIDAYLSEPIGDENTTDVPTEIFKDDKDLTKPPEISLPSEHIILDDMVFGEQITELFDSEHTSVLSNDKTTTETCEKLTVASVKGKQKKGSARSYQCPFCVYKSRRPESLKTHFQTHETNKFVCQECGKKFNSSRGLNIHKKIHSNGKITVDVSALPSDHSNFVPGTEALLPKLSQKIKREIKSPQIENELNAPAALDLRMESTERTAALLPLDLPGDANCVKIEEPVIKPLIEKRRRKNTRKRSCTDSLEENSQNFSTRLKNSKKLSNENSNLQKSLIEVIGDIKRKESLDISSKEIVLKNANKATYCELCKCSFKSKFEYMHHRENHKFPVVLIKRIKL